MNRWRKGQEVYDKLVSSLAEYTSNTDIVDPHQALAMAKSAIPEFVDGLRVSDVTLIHEYLMYITEMRKDIRTPVYVYTGGDRIMAVTKHLIKNIDLELAKQYA